MRATMSVGPPAANATIQRTGRTGYVCALAMRDKTGSAAAPAARCKNLRRVSFMATRLPSTSFDHLVGPGEYGGRDLQTERLCGLEVNQELVFRRVLHRQVGRFLDLQDAVNVASCATMLVDLIRSVGNQATIGGPTGSGIDGWQSVPGRERDDKIPITECRRARGNN